jgi:predicted transcriptional regulator
MVEQEASSVGPIALATELGVAWLSNPNTRVGIDEASAFLVKIHEVLCQLGSDLPQREGDKEPHESQPAVSIRKSLADPDFIISLIDGKPYKSLKRHLSANGLTPDEYRRRYGLRSDYPMVSQNYAQARREVAKKTGLGRRTGGKSPPRAKRTASSQS